MSLGLGFIYGEWFRASGELAGYTSLSMTISETVTANPSCINTFLVVNNVL